ncbi:TPA: scaffolding protein, partial [Escherichia coli]|nr:scaffolding protein [Escherichia coli]
MDQMAENTPEVEIETDTSEQIPDDVELAEEVETEDGSKPSGNDAEEATET